MVKTRMIPTAVVLAFVALAWLFFVPPHKKADRSREENVIVAIEFRPTVRTGNPPIKGGTLTDVVSIFVTVGSSIFPKETALKSPWTHTYHVHPGERVQVHAEQFYGEVIKCVISTGKQSDKGFYGPRLARCELTVA